MKHNGFALYGALAALLTATVALTLSRGTPFATGNGTLKCYEVKGVIESPCDDQPPLIVRTNVRNARSD
jgi:hypothetical protein